MLHLGRTLASFSAAALLLTAGCQEDTGPLPGSNDLSASAQDMSMPPSGGKYKKTTIKAIRQAPFSDLSGATPGANVEFDDVVFVAMASSKTKGYVQDADGGDFSAMVIGCSSSSKTCDSVVSGAASAVGHKITVQGRYLHAMDDKGGYETFYVDAIMDSGTTATAPAPAPATLAEVARGTKTRAKWFQKVNVSLGGKPLYMFDWHPKDMTKDTATACPYMFGFAMKATAAPPTDPDGKFSCKAECSNQASDMGAPAGCVQAISPLGTGVDPDAVNIGTEFYTSFKISADCLCASVFGDKIPAIGSMVPGDKSISGFLNYFGGSGSSPANQTLQPQNTSDVPLSP